MTEKTERNKLAAPCGMDCGICELNLCKDDPQLMDVLISKNILKDRIPCAGCRDIDGNCPVIGSKCETYICVTSKGIDFCYECNEFPCTKLQPASDRANILPHNMKVYNLCTIKWKGLGTFIKQSNEIKQRYYKGKIAVGQGPQLS